VTAGLASIAIVNPYKRRAATTIDARIYESTLKKIGYSTRWYQCVDNGRESDYFVGDVSVPGLNTPFEKVNLAANLMFIWPRKLRNLQEDLILVTDQVLTRLVDYTDNCVIVVHDLRELAGARTHVYGMFLFRMLIRKLPKAKAIIAVSENTKKSIEFLVDRPPPIFVLHHTTDLEANASLHVENSIRRIENERILRAIYPVVDRPYKNIGFLISLARELERPRDGFGFKFLLRAPLRQVTQLSIERTGVRFMNTYVETEDPAKLYNNADILVFPSMHEGFGKPLIEAMRFGMPIVANNLEPIREVVGDGGILLPPNDTQAWCKALRELSQPENYRVWAARASSRFRAFSAEVFERNISSVMDRLTRN